MSIPRRDVFISWPAEVFTLHGSELIDRFERWISPVDRPRPLFAANKQAGTEGREAFYMAAFRTVPDWPGVPSQADQVRAWLRAEAAEAVNIGGEIQLAAVAVTPNGQAPISSQFPPH